MKFAVLLASAVVVWGASVAPAAVVTVTDCTQPPVVTKGAFTLIDAGADDLVIACQLVPLLATTKIKVHARTITVQGPAGGIDNPRVGIVIVLMADNTIVMKDASVQASNANGGMKLKAKNGFDIQETVLTTGDSDKAGRSIYLLCTAANCPLTMLKSNVLGHILKVRVQGLITAIGNTVVTRGPRDLIDVRTARGDAILCCDDMGGHNESTFMAQAFCQVNLTQSEINVAENITVISGIGDGACTTSTGTLLTDATLRNDFGKYGEIRVTAEKNAGTIDVGGATLIDDDSLSPGDISTLNGCQNLPRSGCPHVVGTAATDS